MLPRVQQGTNVQQRLRTTSNSTTHGLLIARSTSHCTRYFSLHGGASHHTVHYQDVECVKSRAAIVGGDSHRDFPSSGACRKQRHLQLVIAALLHTFMRTPIEAPWHVVLTSGSALRAQGRGSTLTPHSRVLLSNN